MRKYDVSYRDWCNLEDDFKNHNDPIEFFDAREGSLLDSFICGTKNLTIVAFERYETAWSSYLEVWVAQTEGDCKKVWDKWQEFADAYDEEYGEED